MADPIGNFAGLGSGFDYTDLVNQIIQAASAPATQIQSRIDKANAQISAYTSYSSLLSTLETSAKQLRDGTAFQDVIATVANANSSSGRSVLSAAAAVGAAPGSYAVQVLQTAQAAKLSGATFASDQGALGLTGDFLINGKVITVAAGDTLGAIRDRINAVNTGSSPSGVSASIVTDSSNAQRLVLTSGKTGASGIDLVDGAQSVAQQLGWVDASQSIKHLTSAGAQSDNFASATTSIASQLGLVTTPAAQTITIGGQTVNVDLGTDSLTSIAAKLSALTGIQASVMTTTVNGATKYYLDIRNTTNFVDAGNTLEQLGVLVNGRSAVEQTVQSAALTAGDASTPASASTLLADLWNGGSASNAAVGDTLTITGTRGDGSAVNLSFTLASGSTVQDLLDTLNNTTDGFGAGSRPATASVDASGHIVVTDGTTGQSSLGLQIVANNEGGGRLDLGAFSTSSTGRSRELVAGTDARFTVDGVAFTRPSNTVTDVIADTTLTLTAADPNVTANVTIDRSLQSAQSAVQGYVDAYNKVVDYIKQQQTPGADSSSNPTLYNDGVLRLERSSLSQTMLNTITGAAPDMATAGMVGVSLTKDGHLSLDATKFQTAFTTRYSDVQKLFMEQGTSTNTSLYYTSSTSATTPGSYDVNITQAASKAQLLGVGFSGTYADDGTPDVMTVTDANSNSAASIQLTNGMTTTDIVNAMNAAFTTPTARKLDSSTTLTDASGVTPATASTLLVDLKPAGTGVTAGDTIAFSGLRSDGTAYSSSLTIGATSTVGDLVAQIQTALGSTATVSFANGKISVLSATTGNSQLSLTLTPGNEGGGSLDFGAVTATESGHGPLSLTAVAVGNQIQITHNAYGSVPGITVSFAAGGADGTGQLGIAAGSVHGTDVQGTIGGYAATGSGQQLVGASGTPIDGLSAGYTGTATGTVGTLGLTVGVGAAIDRLLTVWTQAGGTIASKQSQLNDLIASQQRQLDNFNARMEVRRQTLLKQYLAMDTAVQKLNAQGSALLSAFSSASSNQSSNS